MQPFAPVPAASVWPHVERDMSRARAYLRTSLDVLWLHGFPNKALTLALAQAQAQAQG